MDRERDATGRARFSQGTAQRTLLSPNASRRMFQKPRAMGHVGTWRFSRNPGIWDTLEHGRRGGSDGVVDRPYRGEGQDRGRANTGVRDSAGGIRRLIPTCTFPCRWRHTVGQKGSGPRIGERFFGLPCTGQEFPGGKSSSRSGSRSRWPYRMAQSTCSERDWLCAQAAAGEAIQRSHQVMSGALTRHVVRSSGSEWSLLEGAGSVHPDRKAHR